MGSRWAPSPIHIAASMAGAPSYGGWMMDRNFRSRAARAGRFAGVIGSAAGLVLVTCTTGWAAPSVGAAPGALVHDNALLSRAFFGGSGGIAPTGTIKFELLTSACKSITPAALTATVPVTDYG